MLVPVTDAQAEAAKAVAETTRQAIGAVEGVGGWIAATIGTIPSDILGITGGDWLSHQRQRNLAKMQYKTAKILRDIPGERLNEPSPSVVVPLLEAAADEGREELQDLWAALLARAMVDGGTSVRRQFFEVVRRLEPQDAIVLRWHASQQYAHDTIFDTWQGSDRPLAMSATEWDVCINALFDLKCFSAPDPGCYRFTPFGFELIRLCGQSISD